MKISISHLDTEHFGTKIARCELYDCTDISYVDKWCAYNDISMVIVRCDAKIGQYLDKSFEQMDTLVYYEKLLEMVPFDFPKHMRIFRNNDLCHVEKIARIAFNGYDGHYHRDKRFDSTKSTDVYVNWALSPNSDICKFVYDDGAVKGFVLIDTAKDEVPLYAVDKNAQGVGIGKVLIKAALVALKQNGKKVLSISTQESNNRSIGVWKSLDFRFVRDICTFHKWYK